jgi:predicted nuclease of predicted toxin-antitoxin system
MKLLLDTCVWGGVKKILEEARHDVVWGGDWDQDPGDDEIISYAFREKRTLVTLDKDFGELAIVHRVSHCGIIRLVGLSSKQQATVCLAVLARYDKELLHGAIITANIDRLRIRLSE